MARTLRSSRSATRGGLHLTVALGAALQLPAASTAAQATPPSVQVGSDCKSTSHWEEHPGGATLATPADVAEFAARYRSVAGDLTIEGPSVIDTDALACLERIDGDLWVMNNPELAGSPCPPSTSWPTSGSTTTRS